MSRSTKDGLGESRIRDIALDEIDRSRNHRIPMPGDEQRIEALKMSIEACGQLQPVRVYERGKDQKEGKDDQPYILGFGNRRCSAMELLGRRTIRAMVFAPASDAEIAQAKAVENLHRQDITPLEEVQAVADVLEAIKAQKDFAGDPHEEAATRLARSVSWVRDRDYLHRLTKPVQKFAMRSGLPAGHLRELSKVGDAIEQMRLACESAGAPSWSFLASEKDSKTTQQHHQQMQDGYFAELADGKVDRWPLGKLKSEVAKVQLSLKVIPWEFDKLVQHCEVKLRKCAGCSHNSESDRTLFGIDEDAANPRGFCLNSSCYNAKHQAAEVAKQEVYVKVSKQKVQNPEAIRLASPDWLKESTVIGYVKRQLEKAAASKVENPVDKPRATAVNSARKLTEHEKAVKQYMTDLQAWYKNAYPAVLRGVNSDPAHKVSWCILLGVQAFWEQPQIQEVRISEYQPPCTKNLTIPELPEAVASAIKIAFKGNRTQWLELLKGEKQINPGERGGFGWPLPSALILIAAMVGVKLKALPKPVAPVADPSAESTAKQTDAVAI